MENENELDKEDQEDQQERERLKSELEDEFEEPVDATPEDLQMEETLSLTGKEEEWKEQMMAEVGRWKHDASTYTGAEQHIRGIHEDTLEEEEPAENVKLYHAFEQAKESPTPYFRQKRDRLIRKRVRETDDKVESSSYHFAKVIEALSQTE